MTRRMLLGCALSIAGAQSPIRKLHGGFTFTEGPVCGPRGSLYFSDVGQERIYHLSQGVLRVIRNSSNLANGLALDAKGRLVVCERGRLTRTETDGRVSILADTFEGKGLHWPNDLSIHSNGTIFFTDLKQKDEWANPAKTGYSAVYRWSPSSDLKLFAKDCQSPNGLALSPRQDSLFVADTAAQTIRVYDLSTGQGRVFAEIPANGGPDGIKTDRAGNVWVCDDEGVLVFNSQGELQRKIQIPESPSNCAFAPDGRTLFVTAKTSVYALAV